MDSILICDGEFLTYKGWAEEIESLAPGYPIHWAQTAKEGISLLKSHPDIAVIVIGNVRDALGTLRRSAPHVLIVVVTTLQDPRWFEHLREGADHVTISGGVGPTIRRLLHVE